MPGFTIHIAVATEYVKKHKNEIINENEFFDGTIAPDLSEDKYKSHYGKNLIGVYEFLQANEFDITSDYGKGYFLHLLVDEAFYHNYFKDECAYATINHKNFYKDYGCLNEMIINDYKVTYIPEIVKKHFEKVEGKSEILNPQKIKNFINRLSEISIEKQIDQINKTKQIII